MQKMLGFVGSPRKGGNTDRLVRAVLAGAEARGATTRLIYLSDLNIRECDGCHACWRGGPCAKKDDLLPIYAEIAASDQLVFGTPVYWYGPTALMKLMIDRWVYFNCPANRPQVRGKKAAVVIPFEEETPATAALTVDFFARTFAYLEMRFLDQLLVPGVAKRGEVAERSAVMGAAQDLGSRLTAI